MKIGERCLEYVLFIIKNVLDEVKKTIGRGAFSEVLLVEDVESGQMLALKKIVTNEVVRNEFSILSKIISEKFSCSNIIRIYGSFIEDENLYIVMEYCEKGCLTKMIQLRQKTKDFFEENVWFLFYFNFFFL
jgi:serine/threonine protein kinase